MEEIKRELINLLKKEQRKRQYLFFPREDSGMSSISKPNKGDKSTPQTSLKEGDSLPIPNLIPDLSVLSSIPSDSLAKKKASEWKEPYLHSKVLILSLERNSPSFEFLKHLEKGLQILGIQAHVVEESFLEVEAEWNLALNSVELQLIIVPPIDLWKERGIIKVYRQNRVSNNCFLKGIPLLVMEPIIRYLGNPNLKRNLWKRICLLLSMSI